MLEILPYPYFMNLFKILLVKPTFGQKASRYFSFGVITKFLNSHLEYVDNVKELGQKIFVSIQEISESLSPNSQAKFIEENKHKIKKEIIQNEIKQNINQIPTKKVQRQKFEITEYVLSSEYEEKGDSAIPIIFQTLVYYFKQHPEGLKEEGLFRKSVSIEEETEICTQMSKKHYDCIEQIKNPHIIANLIKRFVSELATPIIPYEIFYDLMEWPNLNPEYICSKMKDLANINITKLLTLLFLLEFILTSVVSHAEQNKMNTLNISICLAPCLMKASEITIKEILYAKKSVEVLTIMLNNFEEVFGNKKDQKQLYRSSYFQHRKKSMKSMLTNNEKTELENHKNEISKQEEEIFELKLEKNKSEVDSYWSESSEEYESLNIHSNFKKELKTNPILTHEKNETKNVLNEVSLMKESKKKGIFTSNLPSTQQKEINKNDHQTVELPTEKTH